MWVGRDDKTIHRVQIDTAGSGDAQSTGSLSIDFSVVPGEAVPVQAPEGAKPITDLLTQGLGDALGIGDLDLSQLLGGMTTGANA